ncbi:MAG: hypothetical protein AAFX54_13335 [Pseudomonadota bacterium]
MAVNKLIWVGLACCLAALTIQVFPEAAFRMGADVKASWLVFGFGLFLIVIATFASGTGRRGGS